MATITLLGSNSGRNAGDAAILAAIMGSLSDVMGPDTAFEVPTTHPQFVDGNYSDQFRVKGISVMPWTGSIRLLGIPTFRSIARTDAVMITDGIIFDVKLFNPLFNFLITLIFLVPWAKLLGKKVICYSVGIGPLESFWGRTFARWVGNASDLIMVRDEDSLKLFREIGVQKEIHLTADAVFSNWGVPASEVERILLKNDLKTAASENRLLGVNVTRYVDMWLKKSEKVSSKESFLPSFAKVLADLKGDLGLEPIIFITQVMDADFGRKLSQFVADELKKRGCEPAEAPKVISNEVYTNHELLGVASRCRLLVGMRVHSLIIAAQSGTPVVGLVYAPKVRSFLKQLNTPEWAFELAELSPDKLKSALEEAWNQYQAIQESQQAVVIELRKRAVEAAHRVCELLRPGKLSAVSNADDNLRQAAP